MTDYSQINLDANYTIRGVEAEIGTATDPETVTVIDKTDGIEVGGEAQVQTVVPAATVRISELTEKEITRAELIDATITFNSKSWTIRAARPRPTPDGEDAGELLLLLEEA